MPYSGNPYADALLGKDAMWNFWPDGRNVLYFTFDVGAASVARQEGGTTTQAFNASQKQAAREILHYVSTVTGILFQEVARSEDADVHFAVGDIEGSATVGWCSRWYRYWQDGSGKVTSLEAESVVLLDNAEHRATTSMPSPGTAGYQVLLHEVGHMLGLDHPFDSARPLSDSDDHTNNTVMSYTWRGSVKTQFQTFDLLALDWLYGRDGLGGLRGFNSVHGPTLALEPRTDVWRGTAANDRFVGGNRDEVFDGAAGTDALVLSGKRADYVLRHEGGGWTLTDRLRGRDGSDTLVSMERLHFSDTSLALDLDGDAGVVARLIGVVLGQQALQDRALVGLVLGVVDSGVTVHQLHTLAVGAVWGGVTDNAVVVAQIYQNLFQQAPDAAAMRYLVQGLDAGQFSRADLVGVAAMQSINAVNIDLVGLSITGLEYLATPV